MKVNKNWRKLKYEIIIWGAISNWKEYCRIQVAQNATELAKQIEHLVGRISMVVFGDLAFRITKQGNEDKSLGQWATLN